MDDVTLAQQTASLMDAVDGIVDPEVPLLIDASDLDPARLELCSPKRKVLMDRGPVFLRVRDATIVRLTHFDTDKDVKWYLKAEVAPSDVHPLEAFLSGCGCTHPLVAEGCINTRVPVDEHGCFSCGIFGADGAPRGQDGLRAGTRVALVLHADYVWRLKCGRSGLLVTVAQIRLLPTVCQIVE